MNSQIVNKLFKPSSDIVVLHNNHFTLGFSKNFGRAMWSCCTINPVLLSKCIGGRTFFSNDNRLIDKSVYHLDKKSPLFKNNWSRGHLCSSYLMSFDKTLYGSWTQTYLMSNIIPQNPDFNSGLWNQLETNTINFIKKMYEPVTLITGVSSSTSKNLWYDEDKQFKFIIPNIFYQILITQHEELCYIGYNEQGGKVYKVKINDLISLFGT